MKISIMRKAALYTFCPFMAFLTFKGGKGGGASPPPPPRDWTPENIAEGKIEFGRRQQEADKWNDRVAGYNKEIGGFKRDWGDPFGAKARSANIASANLGDLIKEGTGYQDEVSDWGYAHTDRAPTWSASYQAAHGATPVGSPDTTRFQEGVLKGIGSKLNRSVNNLSSLQSDRTYDLGLLNQAKSKYAGGMRMHDSNIDNYGINQLNLAKNVYDQATNLYQSANDWNAARPSINTGLLGNDYQTSYNQIGQDYSDLQGKHTAETKRIGDFKSGLDDYYSKADMGIAGLNISNLKEMGDYEKELAAKSRGASRFSSVLPYDFSNQQTDLRGLSSRIAGLQSDRGDELNRVSGMQSDYAQKAGSMRDLASLAGIYNKGDLDLLSADMTGLRGDIGNFNSLLPYDFKKATSTLDVGRSSLDDVFADRKGALDSIINDRSTLAKGLGGINLWDEAGYDTQRSDLKDIYDELSPFSGGRVKGIGTNIDTDRDAIDAKLSELADYRKGLETKAQDLQKKIQDTSYMNLGNLTGDEAALEKQRAEIELYNAQQAMDELDAMTQNIGGQRIRLQTDLDNTNNREAAEKQAVIDLLGKDGALKFKQLGLTDPQTIRAYLQVIRKKKEDEEAEAAAAKKGGAFGKLVGG